MARSFTAAAVQMNSGVDKQVNLRTAERLVREAANAGATLVALPEMFNCFGAFEIITASAEPIPGPTSLWLADLARELSITLVGGSLCEVEPKTDQRFNTSLVFAPDGTTLATYRKMHLFDVDLPEGVSVCESKWITAGSEVVAVDTSLAQLGLSICYDLRFGALYRKLADATAEVLLVPAAFTTHTGRDHWQVLLRARAIESQAFVIAPNQWGEHEPNLSTYGHSMIIDPWGKVHGVLEEGDGYVLAEIDLDYLHTVRAQLPSLAHRRELS